MNYHMIICQRLWSLQNEKTLDIQNTSKTQLFHVTPLVMFRNHSKSHHTPNWSSWPSGQLDQDSLVGVQCLWRKQGEAAKKETLWMGKGSSRFGKKQIRCSLSSSNPPPTKFRRIGFGKKEDAALHWPFLVQSFMSLTMVSLRGEKGSP